MFTFAVVLGHDFDPMAAGKRDYLLIAAIVGTLILVAAALAGVLLK